VVASFELRVHAPGPEVFAVDVAYPIEDGARVLAGWRDAAADAPDELSTAGLIWSLPAVDELPEQLRELATPLLDMSERVDYLAFQRSLEAATRFSKAA